MWIQRQIAWFDRAGPDGAPYFAHTVEGPDDMPAHIKSSLTGSSLVLPIADGRLALGTWHGIYLCEHPAGGRRSRGRRRCSDMAAGLKRAGR